MPDHTEQGPLDPAFAKFREQKLVEKLADKLKGKAPASVSVKELPKELSKELPDPNKAIELAKDDPEFGKFLTKRLNEAQAEQFEKDDARLVFGASLHGGPAESAAPATKRLETPGAMPRPAPAAPAPLAAEPPAPPAWGQGARATKPSDAIKQPAPKPPSGSVKKPSGGIAKAAPVLPTTKLPPRPSAPPSGDVTAQLVAIATGLNAILGESTQRALELKVASSEGLDRALVALEAEARRVREYVGRNEALAAETAEAARRVDEKLDAQEALEEQVLAMRARADGFTSRVAGLRDAIAELEAMAAESETEVADLSSAVDAARSEVNALTDRLAAAEDQAKEVARNRDRLAENVERLEMLKEAHLKAITRLKDMKDSLTTPVS